MVSRTATRVGNRFRIHSAGDWDCGRVSCHNCDLFSNRNPLLQAWLFPRATVESEIELDCLSNLRSLLYSPTYYQSLHKPDVWYLCLLAELGENENFDHRCFLSYNLDVQYMVILRALPSDGMFVQANIQSIV